jgi:anti-sigma factor RsiW
MVMRPVRPLVCDRVRGQISLALDGELSQLERAMLSSHVERCASCRAYQAGSAALTSLLRGAPLEAMARPVLVHRRRRSIAGTRVQVAAVAAIAVAALVGAGQLMQSEPIELNPAVFIPSGAKQVKLPSPEQLEREQAILERAQVGRPVQLQGQVL